MKSIPKVSVLAGPTNPENHTSVNKIFEEIANSTFTNNVALIFEENGVTRKYRYSDIDTLTNRLARSINRIISDNNLGRNEDGDYVIAVSMFPSDYLVLTLLAIWKAGAAYLPLDPSFPKQRVEHILGEAKPAIVIYEADGDYFVNTFKLSVSDLFSNCYDSLPHSLDNTERLDLHKIAIILYTSGSTGVPKGVRLTHSNILNRLRWQFKTFPYKTETAGVFKTALTFVDSVSEIWGPLISGLSVLVVPRGTTQNPEKLIDVLEKYKIERLVLVPSLLRALLEYFQMNNTKHFLPHLKTWVCSGETLLKSLAVEFYNYFPDSEYRLCNFYGSTEIMGDVTYHVVSNLEELNHTDKIPIGLPIDNTTIYLLNSNLNPVQAGEIGELYVAGSNVAAGYVNNRDSERFVENKLATDLLYSRLYRTGDYARIEKNTLMYEGRTDSQIKIRGHRVDISEVENAVNAVEGVDKAAVLCYKPGKPDQALLAFIESDASTNEAAIEKLLKKVLTSYMVPQVILIDTIPLLVNGKVDRKLLLYNYENCDDIQYYDFTGVPESKMAAAKVLFEIVASVVNMPKRTVISTKTNFYDMGGTSLNTISTIVALKNKGYYASIDNFMRARNFEELLERISSKKLSVSNMLASSPAYSVEMLSEKHKAIVVDMIVTSFQGKSEWGRWMTATACKEQSIKLWPWLMLPEYAELSFIVNDESGSPIGVALNFDARDEPKVEANEQLALINDFLDSVELPIREMYVPLEKGRTLHSYKMATQSSLTPIENVAVIRYMEEKVYELAKRKNFEAILATNTSPLTQQLGTDFFQYEILADVQVNKYVTPDGTRPFSLAPDYWRALVQRKWVK